LRHIRSHLSLQLTNINQAPIDKSNSEEHPNAEAKMRKRHEEEAAEMTRLNKELEYFKHGTAATAQLKRKIEEQARDIKTLKEMNQKLMMHRSTEADRSRKMQKLIIDAKIEKDTMQKLVDDAISEKSAIQKFLEDAASEKKAMQKFVEDAKNETEAMKARIEDGDKLYNNLIQFSDAERSKRIRDTHFERSKRLQAEQKLQELLAAQKAIAVKFGG
jgi:hypothetical protein